MSALRELGDVATLDPRTREEIKARTGRRLKEIEHGRRHRDLARMLAGAAALLIALAGLGMILSRDALPGSPLYAVKRVTESAELGLTFGEEAKATRHLRFAATRLDELRTLHSPNHAAMADFEREVRAGTTALTELGVQGTGQDLDDLSSWAQQQTAKSLPFPEVTNLLGRIDARAHALSVRLDCDQITSGATDDLGVLPAEGTCQPPKGSFAAPGPAAPPAAATPSPASSAGIDATRSSESASTPTPTGPVPPAHGTSAPSAINAPILAPTSTQAPNTTTPTPPLLSIPPPFPGLPGLGIG